MDKSFKQLLKESFKSNDTEETLDVYFTRPIGLAFALMWIKIGVTPNFVTILSMFLGAAAGFCFYHTELWWNVCGVVLLMLANFCDSTDGQMARLTNHKTVIGRMLDGLASDVWFFCCYLGIALRLWSQPIPLLDGVNWGIWGFLLCGFAGFYWHARQCQLADYYRQIHLYFIKGEEGSELNSTAQEQRILDAIPQRKIGPFTVGADGHFWEYVFHYFYIGWCRKQEKNTPEFQKFFKRVKERYPNAADMPQELRQEFRSKSLSLMWMTNTLTHNTRATVMYIACLINIPWIYPLFEITVLAVLYYYMKYRHEKMCREIVTKHPRLRRGFGRLFVLLLLALHFSAINAQTLTGHILDAQTGDTIPFASCIYRGHGVAVASDLGGYFKIARHQGWPLTFSAVGYQQQTIVIDQKTPAYLRVRLKPDTKVLKEVTVKSKRQRYSRKNNPAVELMRKVVAAKKRTDLSNHDFYQYNKYQKLTLAMNDITPAMLDSGKFAKKQWLLNQIEVCPYNNKLILPISVDETVSQKIYRKSPHDEKTIIKGMNNTGINELIQTGDILTTAMHDVFTDVNIYDDQIRLLQYPFTSPIGDDAIAFYRYYIEDTIYVDHDLCFHLQFLPNNQQDFGFRGHLYILADSSYQVKRCEMTIPKRSDVNFVENMKVTQEFRRLPNGEWVLSVDDMFTELKVASFLQQFAIIRNTRLTDYAFDELPKQLFKGKKKEVKDVNAMMQSDDFWAQYRQVELTKSENSMDAFVHGLEQTKGFKYIIFGLKAFIENFVETGSKEHPSKVDIGPINTMISQNTIDGLRTRFSAQTTANLDSNFFASGYVAHGWDSRKTYYKGDLIWSFNKKEYLPREFPKRTLTLSSSYDIESPSDKFMRTDKDNVFTSFKWAKTELMQFYNRQSLTFEREEDWGFRTTVALKCEEDEGAGNLFFVPLSKNLEALEAPLSPPEGGTIDPSLNGNTIEVPSGAVGGASGTPRVPNGSFRTTELRAEIRFAPGETFINTKQRRLPINLDSPVFTLGHTMGFKGLLGGDYRYNLTQASIYKRFWLKSWGKVDCLVKGGIQWDKVPFPLLIAPETNLSYILQDYTFMLVNNMEFLNDRYAAAIVSWDLNGKIFNRIPLLKRLKWREWLSARCFWGTLSDKNNPTLAQNAGSDVLMYFPEGCYILDSKRPYWEVSAGIHNIFKIIHVEYVRRLNYLDLPTAHKQGIRFMVRMTF